MASQIEMLIITQFNKVLKIHYIALEDFPIGWIIIKEVM